MSSTFSVSYQNVAKKVTCKTSASVNQLVALSLEKFKLSPSTNGTLTNGGKKLDGMTPIRLTGLVNNAKLTLNITSGPYDVTLKLLGTVDGVSVSKIIKVVSDEKLSQLTLQFLREVGQSPSLESKIVELSIMRQVISSSQPEFEQMTVGSLVGSSSNAVVRINVEDKDFALRKKEEVRRANEENEARRLAEADGRKSRRDLDMSVRAASVNSAQSTPQVSRDIQNHSAETIKESSESGASQSWNAALGIENDQDIHQNEPTKHPLPNSIPEPTSETSSTRDAHTLAPTQAQIQPSKKGDVWTLPVETQDTLYVPSSSTRTYENPDEDYELTSNQAEKYYKILKSMQGRPPAKKAAKKPTKYTIRIRFPDRTLLDLHFEDPSTKLGQVLRKLDTYLLEKHINNYHLKNGLPPFEEIAFGFATNNVALQDHPHFQQEKMLLIWETSSGSSGPFLKSDVQRKDVSELPTVVLESHRGDLEEEEETKKTKSGNSSKTEQKAKPRAKGLPKWFRP